MSSINLVGKLLDHRYHTVKVLAAGGFGHTYLAEDTRRPNHPLCVVKHLVCQNRNAEMAELAVKMFHREAEVLEKLTAHPQIPQLLAYFEEAGEFYIVQQYIEGHSITKELSDKQSWAESKVRAFLAEMLPILQFIHDQGVIHRDIKPSNILRQNSDGKLFLIDFGAIKHLQAPNVPNHALTSATISIGTPGYMPIEQGMGKPRPSSDIYGLGMTVIHGITTFHPQNLKEDDDGELIWKPFAHHLTPELIAFLERMVRSHFKERFRNGSEALADFQRLPSLDLPDTELQEVTAPQPLIISNHPTLPEPVQGQNGTSPQDITLLNFDPEPVPEAPESQIPPQATTLLTERTANDHPVEPQVSEQRLALAHATTLLTEGLANTTSAVPPPKKQRWRYPLFALAGVVVIGGGLWGGWQWQKNHQAQALLAQLRNLQASGDHANCIKQSNLLLESLAGLEAEVSQIQQSCLSASEQQTLANALQLLEQQKFAEAIALAQNISANSPNQTAAQEIISQASTTIVSQINRNIQAKTDVQNVEKLLTILPTNYRDRQKVTESVRNYRQLWDKNKATVNKINQAFREQKWQEAADLYQNITIPTMQRQVKWISDRAQREIANSRVLPTIPSLPVETYTPPTYNPPPVYTPPVSGDDGDDRPPPVYAD